MSAECSSLAAQRLEKTTQRFSALRADGPINPIGPYRGKGDPPFAKNAPFLRQGMQDGYP